MQAARFSKVSRIYLITTLLFFVCGLGCSKEKNETPEDKSLPSGKVIESQVNGVTFDSVNGLVISGNSLNKLVSAKFKKDNDEIELGLVSKSTSQAKFSFPISRSLKSGLWSLVLTEAQAQGQLNMYLDAEDNSITDSKVVSVSASKVTGVLAPSVIPDLSSSYAPLTSGKVSHSSLPDLSSTYAPLTAGKVAASVVPDMSANYAPLSSGKVSSSVLPDLSSTYAPLTAGKVALSVVPDLSTIYASLTAGKIAPGSVPDLSGSYASTSHAHTGVYAPVSHLHTATDVGAVNVSTGATDAGKVPKLNSSGKIDSSMIPSRGVKPFIRTTRSSIADSSTDAAKDGLCQSEVGSSFYSATWQDASIYLNTPNGGCWLNYGNTVASSINPFAITGSVYGL